MDEIDGLKVKVCFNAGRTIVHRLSICARLLVFAAVSTASEIGPQAPTRPPDLVAQAVDLADHDRIEDALAMLQRAIANDPSAVRAHAAYIRIKTFYLARYDAVRAEYDALMARQPDNPVYPMALALGTPGAVAAFRRNEWYQRVSQQTLDSVWGTTPRRNSFSLRTPKVPQRNYVQQSTKTR